MCSICMCFYWKRTFLIMFFKNLRMNLNDRCVITGKRHDIHLFNFSSVDWSVKCLEYHTFQMHCCEYLFEKLNKTIPVVKIICIINEKRYFSFESDRMKVLFQFVLVSVFFFRLSFAFNITVNCFSCKYVNVKQSW